ncbi:hypothetical protein Tco_0909423 [Tanacetum coccineum]|uniref:Uncharacterized protein n=1 Tax=Tanacetum coccineum TaxID=301880 RepID=A0ABQ5CS33_9ASTR
MPPTPDLSFTGLDEFVNEHVVEKCKAMSSEEEPKVVRKNDDALIIEEWVLDDEVEDVSQPKIEKKTVRPSIVKKEFVKSKQQEKSTRKTVKQVEQHKQNTHSPRGNQRNWNNMMHMTGNMSYLTNYEEIDGGYVAFGGNPKGGKIAGKAKKSIRLITEKLFGMELELILPSDPSENVADETVHKELGDSLVRAATTASSLEAEQDSGNIIKTRSKATPNESSSLGTTSGGGPRCQETMRDTIAQTRFESVSKHSNDSLLARARVNPLVKKKLGEDATTGRINAIDQMQEITLPSYDKGKGIMIEEPVKPMKKKVQIMLDEEVATKLQAEFDEEERLAREKAKKEKEANIALIEE